MQAKGPNIGPKLFNYIHEKNIFYNAVKHFNKTLKRKEVNKMANEIEKKENELVNEDEFETALNEALEDEDLTEENEGSGFNTLGALLTGFLAIAAGYAAFKGIKFGVRKGLNAIRNRKAMKLEKATLSAVDEVFEQYKGGLLTDEEFVRAINILIDDEGTEE